VVAVPEALVDRLSKGTAKVTLWSEPDRVYDARLRELSPGADADTRTYQVRFTILKAGEDVRFGMTVTVTLSDPASGKIARLPLSAVIDEGKGPVLFVVDRKTGSLEHMPIDVVGYEARDVLVKGGVADGERIVALGTQKLDTRQAPVLILQGNAAKLRRTRMFTGQKSSSSEDHKMGRFNLSAWAVRHPPLVPFLILMLAVAGTFSYLKLGRAEDPNFTSRSQSSPRSGPAPPRRKCRISLRTRSKRSCRKWLRVAREGQSGCQR
jgi:hypothetical protein